MKIGVTVLADRCVPVAIQRGDLRSRSPADPSARGAGDRRAPGRWLTKAGEHAVETVCWVDGSWGRTGPAFDGTEGDGWAVVISNAGLADLITRLGPVTRVFRLSRWGRHDGEESEHVHASNSDVLTAARR